MSLHQGFKKFLRVMAWVAGSVILLLVAAFALLNTDAVQNRLMAFAVEALSNKLQTRVEVKSVSISFFSQDVKLHGLLIEDRSHRKMLQAETFTADVELLPLLNGKVNIASADLSGLDVELYKSETDTVANYQFLIDAFKSDRQEPDDTARLKLNIGNIEAENINVKYNNDKFSLGKIILVQKGDRNMDVKVENLSAAWQSVNQKGVKTDHAVAVESIKCDMTGDTSFVDLNKCIYKSDNHLPRKNTGKPHRGFFDVGHLDVTLNLKATIDYAANDSIHAVLTECTAVDSVSGIDIRKLKTIVAANSKEIALANIEVHQKSTEIKIKSALLTLPDKAANKPFTFSTTTITGKAILKDISRPFAPVLKKFTTPLLLTLRMSGTDQTLAFHDVTVSTADKHLVIKAAGSVNGFRHGEKHQLHVHFDVARMTTNAGTIESIIRQFPVKKFMMKQLKALGQISYTGSFDVLWKKELFRGNLNTAIGALNFDLQVDGLNKYLTGSAKANDLAIGKALDMPDIGNATLSGHFKIDISKERAAAIRKGEHGKLPIGTVNAHVDNASYKFAKVGNLDIDIESNGNEAQGTVNAPHKFIDLGCAFSFTDTDNLKKLKIKPKVKFHK